MFQYASVLIAAVGMLSAASVLAAEPANAAPGGMKLMSGYRHKRLQGKDTRVGEISKEGGLSIKYDIGRLAGNYAKSRAKEETLWRKEQVLGGRPVHLAFAKDRTLYITLPEANANFYATTKSEEEIADILLMVLSYSPTEKAAK
ncbi:MAG: hypothetical protein K8R36_21365 [Planctomycetales bacterium]|nr:hypothetical protein [Planctomycetales bacterium]